MQEITTRIQKEARRLLHDQTVDVVIGYQRGWDDEVVTPCFIREESQVEKLIFDERLPYKEIAGREGTTETAIKMRAYHCKEEAIALREELEKPIPR